MVGRAITSIPSSRQDTGLWQYFHRVDIPARHAARYVAVIGPSRATPEVAAAAFQVGVLIARGGYRELLELITAEPVRRVVSQATTFDRTVRRNYPQLILSRVNYDVA